MFIEQLWIDEARSAIERAELLTRQMLAGHSPMGMTHLASEREQLMNRADELLARARWSIATNFTFSTRPRPSYAPRAH